jgi:integrase
MKTKINVRLLEKLKPGDRVTDTEAKGLFVEVGSTGRIRFRFKGEVRLGPKTGTAREANTVKLTLGEYPALTLDEARRKATEHRLKIQEGQDPRSGTARAKGMWTVATLFTEYRDDMAIAGRADRTIADVGNRYERYLEKDWGPLPVVSITGEMARAQHKSISKNHGKVVANDTLRNFRAAFNWAMGKQAHLGLSKNPVDAVTFWLQQKRTETLTLPDLRSWKKKIDERPNPIRREMHMLALFSGMRPGALAAIRRSWLQLDQGAIVFPATIMKKRTEYHMPLSQPMIDIIKRALAAGDVMFPGSDFLFPSRANKNRTGPVIATKVWKEKDVANETGYILRHMYSNACQAAGVDRVDRRLLLAQTVGDIEGTYLNEPYLFGRLKEQQEKVSVYLLKALE